MLYCCRMAANQRGQNGAFIGAITYLFVYRGVANLVVKVLKLGFMLSKTYSARKFDVCSGQAGSIIGAQEGDQCQPWFSPAKRHHFPSCGERN